MARDRLAAQRFVGESFDIAQLVRGTRILPRLLRHPEYPIDLLLHRGLDLRVFLEKVNHVGDAVCGRVFTREQHRHDVRCNLFVGRPALVAVVCRDQRLQQIRRFGAQFQRCGEALARLRNQRIDQLPDFLHGIGGFPVGGGLQVTPVRKRRRQPARDRRKDLVEMILDRIGLFLQRIDVAPESQSAGHVNREPHEVAAHIHRRTRQRRLPPAATQPSGYLFQARDEFAHMARIQRIHHELPLPPPVRALRGKQSVGLDVGGDRLELAPAAEETRTFAQHRLDGLGIGDDDNALGSHLECEHLTVVVRPAAHQSMQFGGLKFKCVAQQRKPARTGKFLQATQPVQMGASCLDRRYC